MSKTKNLSIVPDCGRVPDCLGLCAICETVLETINEGIQYSEDGGKMADWGFDDLSIYTDKELLAMLRETERAGFEEDKSFCYNIRKELSDRWKKEADRKHAKKLDFAEINHIKEDNDNG